MVPSEVNEKRRSNVESKFVKCNSLLHYCNRTCEVMFDMIFMMLCDILVKLVKLVFCYRLLHW